MQHSIIKKELVRLAEAGAVPAPARAPAARAARHTKAVQLLRVGARVRALELLCSCGERSVIELEYPDDNPPTEAP
jgi:hypothetical protein